MDSLFRMRRSSPAMNQSNQEPLIVVEESESCEKEEETSYTSTPRQSLDIDSPENPYLLSPWRDPRETRKHSLPTPPCTSGITASQVRRLSERGGEGSGPSPREQAFLATLYSAPAPQPGGRRHSVVTISKVPPTIFGRNRRESIAALPAEQRSTASSRRESKTGPPPSTDHRASSATEINRCGDKDYPTPQTPQSSPSFKSIIKTPQEQQLSGSNLKKNRSNSFDISLYNNIKQLASSSSTNATDPEKSTVEPGWFTKRHQPMARRKSMKSPNTTVSFAKEVIDKFRDKADAKGDEDKSKPKESRSPLSKLKWDGRSAIVDARMIGHAIENFITGSSSSKKSSKDSSSKSPKKPSSGWFGKADDDDQNDKCDSSICSTLKDLFVK
ncbi:uncharacterized protein LOC129762333 isoform X2 [Toxorhynchites rutilus septentrionalis]|uniref:uncharacterized protein LOC129762333 isoform X2 n=1 Tax=Toxorhynchites rutilus septentrionalis TaxID=329112 RepID=UPI00247AC4D7|nr:uncharacterized protein LOC129762333 isoform X2 [Toxorhynchites rutilus septentrionalis]